ncbi:MAG: helix-turn-helix domain-containing protein [Nitrospiraceae bacterium]|nr:helix-turn-helix domain-containing protein [Nitrospiraceae bacterium]
MKDLGSILKEVRLARGLDLGEVARRTCINPRYLRAMEDGKFNLIPKVFDKGYLKIYATHLELDANPLLMLLDQMKQNAAGLNNKTA